MRKLYAMAVMTVVVAVFLTGSQARAQATSQSITSHGLTVYFGVLPAEIAKGVAAGHGQANMHGPAASTKPTTYHLVVAIFNVVTGDRIIDATVTASMTQPGSQTPSKTLEPMKIADTVTYGNFFDLPSHGIYRVRLSIARNGGTRPTQIDLNYERP